MTTLKLSPNASGAGSFTIAAPSTSSDFTLNLPSTLGTNNGSALVSTDASGNLGLGVAPKAWGEKALQVGPNAAVSSSSAISSFSSNVYWTGSYSGQTYINNGYANAYLNVSGEHRWYNAPSGTAGGAVTFTQAMTLDASGNLGVGTTSPSTYGRVVSSGGTFSLVTDTASQRRLSFWSTANGNSENAYIQVQNDGSTTNTGHILFATKNSGGTLAERVRITSDGLLVGTTSAPGSGVMRVAAASSSAIIQIERTSTAAGSGYIGANVDKALTVYNQSISEAFYVTHAGACYNATGTYGSFSDIKLKENVQDARGYLSDLCRVRVVKYSLKSEEKQEADKLGVIAQELEQIFPGMVEESADLKDGVGEPTGETTKTVKYSVFVPMLIKAIQEQQTLIQDQLAIINTQQTELEQLKAQLTSVSADVAALKGAK